jgi:hypothetical protein
MDERWRELFEEHRLNFLVVGVVLFIVAFLAATVGYLTNPMLGAATGMIIGAPLGVLIASFMLSQGNK